MDDFMSRRDEFDRRWDEQERKADRFFGVVAIGAFLWALVCVAAVVTAIVLAWKHWG